jgi:hypothetical protein
MAMRPAMAAGLASVLLALPAAAAARPHIAEFALGIAPVAQAAGAHARTVSPVVTPGRRFDLVGVGWRGTRALTAGRLRVRVDGRWRPWVPLGAADSGPHASDPVWAGGASALQLSWRGAAPRHMRLHFIRVTHRPRPRVLAHTAQTAGPPPIIPRSQWDPAGECRPRSAPQMGTVQMAFVHHTVSANDYTADQSAAIVLSICRYHRDSNGWNDIGYNFLVDKYGQLFEGRAGGIDQPVVGAQAQGWNSQSTSVSNIGTYSTEPQSDAALQSMAQLLAWKLTLHGVPVTGTVTLKSGGGPENRYPAGRLVTFQRISGHRDGGKTECPGDALYAQLPQLRDMAAADASGIATPAPAVTLNAVTTALHYPEPAMLSGSLSGGGRVAVQVSGTGGFVTVAHADPAPDGTWSAELPLTRGHQVRAMQIAPDGSHGAVSAPLAISLTPELTAQAPRRVLMGRAVTVTGAIGPHEPRVSIALAFQGRGGRFNFVRRITVATRRGAFRSALLLRRPGVYRIGVHYLGSSQALPAQAPDLFVRAARHTSSLTGGAAGRAAR